MKTTRVFLMTSILLLPLIVNAQNSIFDKYSDMKDISSVYISKTMIEMQPDLYTKDLYIGKVAGQLDAVYVISTMDNSVKKEMRKDIEQFIQRGKYELLMKQKGRVSRSAFYVKRKGDKVKELVMITDGAATLKYISLSGDLTLKDIQNITNYQHTSLNFIIPSKDRVSMAYDSKIKNIAKIIGKHGLNKMILENTEEWKDLKEELKDSGNLNN